jgi:tetratricopeptide (TPR) repeat protein
MRVSDGFSIPGRREQAARVRLALELDPLCADAYTIRGQLAAQYGKFYQAKWEYEKAMRIAAFKIGPEALASAKVRKARGLVFWADRATRDYMRPRAALAFLLWRRLGDLQGAIAHFQGLLDLDPDDHQGNRCALLSCLVEAGDDEALGSALARHRFYTLPHAMGRATSR